MSIHSLSLRRGLAVAALAALLVSVALPALPAAGASCMVGHDEDGDGLTCVQETYEYGTDIRNPDTDGDGRSDGDEVYVYRSDPLVFDAAPPAIGRLDRDGDGLYDDDELVVYGTNPSAWDTDGDGSSDGEEIYLGSDPTASGGSALSDSDEDGLYDWDEANVYGTNPYHRDTDGDGIDDGEEVYFGSDPTA